MLRKIIKIDTEKCNGCGLRADVCHKGAIGLKEGKAYLLRDNYCDGSGDCLPVCPTEAITFEEREAAAYDEAAVKKNAQNMALPCGCPGSHARAIEHTDRAVNKARIESEPHQWPVQIKLIPTNAPHFEGANLLIAADCAAYA